MNFRSPFHIDPRRHAIALTLGIVLFGAGVAQANETVVAVSAAQIDALGVQLQSPRRVAASEAAPWSARVIPAPDAEWIVAAHVGGVVLKVPVSEGQQVTAGTVLAEISSPEVPELAAAPSPSLRGTIVGIPPPPASVVAVQAAYEQGGFPKSSIHN